MIRSKLHLPPQRVSPLAQQQSDFTAEGSPPPGRVGSTVPAGESRTSDGDRPAGIARRPFGSRPPGESFDAAAKANAVGCAAMPHSLDALDWLARDHAEIRRLFGEFELLCRRHGAEFDRARLAERICSRLFLHMQIEEEIVYPALRAALGDDPVLAHVLLDHAGAQELIARLDAMQFGDPDFNATVAVLEAYFVPHMTEEDSRLTPRMREARLDTAMLGQRIAGRLKALLGDQAPVGATPGHSRRPVQDAGCGPGPAVSRRAMGVSTPGVG